MKVLFEISAPSSGRNCDLLQKLPYRDYLLIVRHEDTQDELRFTRVEALQITHYKACSVAMIAHYDRVTDLGETDWLGEIRRHLESANESTKDLCHIALYLDDGPCYEFICHHFGATTVDAA